MDLTSFQYCIGDSLKNSQQACVCPLLLMVCARCSYSVHFIYYIRLPNQESSSFVPFVVRLRGLMTWARTIVLVTPMCVHVLLARRLRAPVLSCDASSYVLCLSLCVDRPSWATQQTLLIFHLPIDPTDFAECTSFTPTFVQLPAWTDYQRVQSLALGVHTHAEAVSIEVRFIVHN